MSIAPSLSRLHSPFLCCPLKLYTPSLSFTCGKNQRSPASYPCTRAADLDQNTRCRFCMGNGTINVELGGDEKQVSKCINCEGVGSLTCTTCQGSGIQLRYLDRREFKDDD
ncbi:hypothetical protein CRYUN_Cryun35bG0012500 [Craigia yunnanensis]